MSLNDQITAVDTLLTQKKVAEVGDQFYDKSVKVHVADLLSQSGKSAQKNLQRLQDNIGDKGAVNVLGTRVLEEESKTVSLVSFEGDPDADQRFKLLTLVARKWNSNGKIVEEEYLPVKSTIDAQSYFPEQKLSSKQIQPRLSFIAQTRRSKGRSGGRPRKPVTERDIHRIPLVGATVVKAMHKAGIETYQQLSKATDDVLDQVRSESGRRFNNFDFSYWRDAALHALQNNFESFPDPPKVQKKTGKRNLDIDFTKVALDDLGKLPKVGPNLLTVLNAKGIRTFQDLSQAGEDLLETIRIEGGRPFANFDMSYFKNVAQRIVDGAKSIPSPPKPAAKLKAALGKQARDINPNDLHVLPGVGAQMVAALHEVGINTFSDLAEAEKDVLATAREQVKGKYKNINIAYLQRQAKYAAAQRWEKIDREVKIDKKKVKQVIDIAARHLSRLQNAAKQDLEVLPGIGASVKAAMNAEGISTFSQLAKAKEEKLREIAQNAGKRFARFDVNFWKEVAQQAHAGEFEAIPVRPPVLEKPKSTKKDGTRKPREARPPRTPRDNKDLGALPSIGATIIAQLNERGINTFSQLANATEAKLEEVRSASGPKYKTFPVAYWKQVAELAKDGTYEYPAVPAKPKKEKKTREARAAKEVAPTQLEALAKVGASLATALRDNGINTFQEILDAEQWQLLKAASEGGKRSKNMNVEDLRKAAKDAIAGKFPEPQKRGKSKQSSLPEGAQKLSELPGIGKGVQDRLFEHKIMTFSDLAKASIEQLEEVRDLVGKRVAKANVRDWKKMAQFATEGKWSQIDSSKYEDSAPADSNKSAKSTDGDDLTKIKGIGPQAQQMFRSRGIKFYSDVVNMKPAALMSLLDESAARVSPDDYEKVQEAAAELYAKGNGSEGTGKSKGKKGKKSKKK